MSVKIQLGDSIPDWKLRGFSWAPAIGDKSYMSRDGTYDEIVELAGQLRQKSIPYDVDQVGDSPVWRLQSDLKQFEPEQPNDEDILKTETWTKGFGTVQLDVLQHPKLVAMEQRLDAVIGTWVQKKVNEKLADPETKPDTDFTDGLSVAGATEDEQAFIDSLAIDMARGLKVFEMFPPVLTKTLTAPETTNYQESDVNAGKYYSRAGLLAIEPNIPTYIQYVMPEGYYRRLPVQVDQQSDGRKTFQISYEWTLEFARSVNQLA